MNATQDLGLKPRIEGGQPAGLVIGVGARDRRIADFGEAAVRVVGTGDGVDRLVQFVEPSLDDRSVVGIVLELANAAVAIDLWACPSHPEV